MEKKQWEEYIYLHLSLPPPQREKKKKRKREREKERKRERETCQTMFRNISKFPFNGKSMTNKC